MADRNKYDLEGLLGYIDPRTTHYDGWLKVGQALKYEGYAFSAWYGWTAQDASPDHAHRLEKAEYKWSTFGNQAGAPVTGGTIVKMARDAGWNPDTGRRYEPLDWTSIDFADFEEPAIVDASAVSEHDEEVAPLFNRGHETEELSAYLKALFDEDDIIRYVLDAHEDEHGRMAPGRGIYKRTAGELLAELEKGRSLDDALGTLDDAVGAYICINPLDGEYIGNRNVKSYRHALVESDEMPKGQFAAIIKQLNLPVAAMVDSGNKSLHAIVRVDAASPEQYTQRVRVLYERCEKNGIVIDKANKNASRLSRLPGATRNGNRQFLAGLAQGAGDWDEWEEWYAGATDELPEVESLEEAFTNPEELNPELIEGVLRVGHKMLLSGPSKAGKSFALLLLSIALAEGWTWMGMRCRPSRVLYVNLEVDRKSFKKRFADVYNELERTCGLERAHASSVGVWNLRGKTEPMGKLLPKLVRRARKFEADVVIIDPIYKVMVGDENSAGDMAQFANLFDALCEQAGVSVIYCHHHSKGFQGAKRAIDRASGSGVFGRDPDAILDMTELDVDKGDRWKHANDLICAECALAAKGAGLSEGWEGLPDTIKTIEANATSTVLEWLSDEQAVALGRRRLEILGASETSTAWRITSTLREFAQHPPIDVWFDWPLFAIDETLKDVREVGSEEPKKGDTHGKRWSKEDIEKASKARKEKAENEHSLIAPAILEAYNKCLDSGIEPTANAIYDHMPDIDGLDYDVTLSRVKEWTKERNPWCPVVKSDKKAEDGKSAVIVLRKEWTENAGKSE